MPVQSEETKAILEAKLLAEGCVEPLIVWEETNILLDGHTRLAICERHAIEYTTRTVSLIDREDAIQWIRDYALARRNLTEKQIAYFRGRKYREEKRRPGPARNGTKSRREQAEGEGVSESKLKRDIEFAAAVDALPEEKREEAVIGELSRKEVIEEARKMTGARCASCRRMARVGQQMPDNCPTCGASRQRREAGSNGKPLFDDRPFEKTYGELLRFMDMRQNVLGKAPEHGEIMKALSTVINQFREWQKRTT